MNNTKIYMYCYGKRKEFFLLISFFLFTCVASAQTEYSNLGKLVLEESQAPGERLPCTTPAEMKEIINMVERNKAKLRAEGKLAPSNKVSAIGNHNFRWPLAPAGNYYQLGYYVITNYVDHDNATGSLQDWNCGTRTYDNGSYDHDGADISTSPFGWTMMDNNNVDIIAVEGGYVTGKRINQWDRTCTWGVSATAGGNFIGITHSDGSTTFYKHMKDGSLTAKDTGDYIAAGEYLGKLGSSGNSTGPHLHFEIRDDLNNVIDPWVGPCNPTVTQSLWANQEAYISKQILSVFTLDASWTNASCDMSVPQSNGVSGSVVYQNHFNQGETIWYAAAVRDGENGNTMSVTVYDPNGNLMWSNNYNFTGGFGNYSSPAISNTLAGNAPTGTWKVQCTFNGVTRAHFFTVGCSGAIALNNGTRTSNYGRISGSTLSSTDSIVPSARNVQYQAETYVDLLDGFVASSGCQFLARQNACTIGGTREAGMQQANAVEFKTMLLPNPANDETVLHIKLNAASHIAVSIVNVMGQTVNQVFDDTIQESISTIPVSLNNLAPGVYYLQIVASGMLKTERLVKL